ncbi:hypothetical protein D918_10062, partial [Trichuris suis]
MADDDSRINELILCMGPPSNAIFQRCTLTAEEKKTYEKVTKMFSDHFRGARNIVYELARLHRTVQREGEPVDSFINAVFAQAENCDLDNLKMSIKDLLTQSRLIAGMANRKLAAEVQMDPSITLEQVVQRLRLDENIASQQAMIHEASHAADAGDKVDFVASEVDAVTLYRKRVGAPDRYRRQRPEAAAQCPNCGYDAHASVQLCPARRKACNLYKKVGHFAKSRMNDILVGLPGVLCHMVDILVFGRSYEQHDKRLSRVLNRLLRSGLTLNAKCQFRHQSLIFLGHQISGRGMLPDPAKVEALVKMPVPNDVAAVRRFIGMVNHFGRFIEKLAEKTKPLRDLLRENVDFVWDAPQQQAFDELKLDLQNSVELAPFNTAYRTIVSTDASSTGLGAVLLQENVPGVRRAVAFASRCLTTTEQRYAQIEKEAHAVTWACERFRMFLIGKEFHVETDHKPVLALLGQKTLDDLPPRIQRFRMRLMHFNFAISHVPGKYMTAADALSRATVIQPTKGDDDFAAEVTAFVNSVAVDGHPPEARLREIARSQAHDP